VLFGPSPNPILVQKLIDSRAFELQRSPLDEPGTILSSQSLKNRTASINPCTNTPTFPTPRPSYTWVIPDLCPPTNFHKLCCLQARPPSSPSSRHSSKDRKL